MSRHFYCTVVPNETSLKKRPDFFVTLIADPFDVAQIISALERARRDNFSRERSIVSGQTNCATIALLFLTLSNLIQ